MDVVADDESGSTLYVGRLDCEVDTAVQEVFASNDVDRDVEKAVT